MEVRNGKTTVWVPKEAFSSVKKLWKPEFNWIPVPVDRSLPPDQIAYIETRGPVSPLPPPPRTPKSPLLPSWPPPPLPRPSHAHAPHVTPPLPKAPGTVTPSRTQPVDLPPLETGAGLIRQQSGYFFGGVSSSNSRSPELETAITAAYSSPDGGGGGGGGGGTDRPDTPSTATELESPATPKDSPGPALPKPTIWRQSQHQGEGFRNETSQAQAGEAEEEQEEEQEATGEDDGGDARPAQEGYSSLPWKMVDNSTRWKMVDRRDNYRPKDNLNAAAWKTMGGQRNLKMSDRWQTARRDEARWHGSEKGFAVRLDMHLDMEVELKGTVNGDITLSAEALHYDTGECPLLY